MLLSVLLLVGVVCGVAQSSHVRVGLDPDEHISVVDRNGETPSDLQLLVPMVVVTDDEPAAGRTGGASSEEGEVAVDAALGRLLELLSGPRAPQSAPRPPRAQYSPRAPALTPALAPAPDSDEDGDEPCPACMILHAIKAMQLKEQLEVPKRGGQRGQRGGREGSADTCALCVIEVERARRSVDAYDTGDIGLQDVHVSKSK